MAGAGDARARARARSSGEEGVGVGVGVGREGGAQLGGRRRLIPRRRRVTVEDGVVGSVDGQRSVLVAGVEDEGVVGGERGGRVNGKQGRCRRLMYMKE
jgi:hypothetical protein